MTIFDRKVFLVNGESGVPLRRVIAFPFCFHNILQTNCLPSITEKQVAFLSCGVGVSLLITICPL